MATALYGEYVTLGGLLCGSRAIECFEFQGLKGTAKRHAGNFVSSGVAGRTAIQPIEDELPATLQFRVNGRWDQDNVPVARTSWVSNFYSLLSTLMAKLETNTTQTVSLTRPGGGPHSADCLVVDVRGPKHEVPEIATLAAVLLLPGGALL